MPITPLFAALFGLIYIVLSLGVVRVRMGEKISLGQGSSAELEIAVRIHANFSEYVPLSLLLLWFLESISFNSTLVFYLGCTLLIARLAHVVGMNNAKQFMLLRQLGVVGTIGVILVTSIALLWWYLPASV
ncbi:MAG: putative membrane protein YecN with MAPEG domain [Cryomorphaceae bacterium]|jgi:uncharacterized membrane protein YecN with MAPEG domain